MTEAEIAAPPQAGSAAAARTPARLPFLDRVLLFGTGFGVAINERNLEVTIVRARPAGPSLVAATVIRDFRTRPAAEWGAELMAFLAGAKETRLAATVLLPREEVIVRLLHLPGVSTKDIPAAIELQIDTLHPYGEAEIASAWNRASANAAAGGSVIVGLVRKEVVSGYETLFAEAGIPMAAVTFSATVLHSAIRVWSAAPASLLFYLTDGRGRTEVYGESEARALYSAEFSCPPERAIAIARGELRLAAGQLGAQDSARPLREALPAVVNPLTGTPVDLPVLAYAAALAGSASRARRFANLLPPERRASHDRVQYLLPAVLAALLLLSLIAVFVVFPALEQRRYRNDLTTAAHALEPSISRVQTIDRRVTSDRAKIGLLDDLRRRPQADLDVLNELTRLLPAEIWTNSVEIYPDSVVIAGEAPQAAPLLKVLDSSPLFENSEFAVAVSRTAQQTEQFRIKTMRRGRTGRTTP
jgi:Tfp pilus assembly protein PilN